MEILFAPKKKSLTGEQKLLERQKIMKFEQKIKPPSSPIPPKPSLLEPPMNDGTIPFIPPKPSFDPPMNDGAIPSKDSSVSRKRRNSDEMRLRAVYGDLEHKFHDLFGEHRRSKRQVLLQDMELKKRGTLHGIAVAVY